MKIRVETDVEQGVATVVVDGCYLFEVKHREPERGWRPSYSPGGNPGVTREEALRVIAALRSAVAGVPEEKPEPEKPEPPAVDLSGVARGLESLSISVERLVGAQVEAKKRRRRR
jgi:hypothetical protein